MHSISSLQLLDKALPRFLALSKFSLSTAFSFWMVWKAEIWLGLVRLLGERLWTLTLRPDVGRGFEI